MYDGDAQNYLLEDKLEMKVLRHYLWTHGKYTIESVCIGSVHFIWDPYRSVRLNCYIYIGSVRLIMYAYIGSVRIQ